MPTILYGVVLSPPCRAVLMTAEAIGLQLELKSVEFAKGEHLTPEFLKINPQHTVPTLDDDGVIIVDSHAIITYLVSKYAKDDSLYPKDLAKRARVDERLHFDSGTAFSILKLIYRGHIYDGQTEYMTPLQTQKVQEVYDLVNTFLGRSKWVAGDSITVADISLVTTLDSLDIMLAIDDSEYPNVRKWLESAHALPFFGINQTGNEQFKQSWITSSTH